MAEFKSIKLSHRQQAPWSRITHVRLRGTAADTDDGQRILEHIRAHANELGIAAVSHLTKGFPIRRSDVTPERDLRHALRHMANRRDAGDSSQNKGLVDLGWME